VGGEAKGGEMGEERDDNSTGDGNDEIETFYTNSRRLWKLYKAGKLNYAELVQSLGELGEDNKIIGDLYGTKPHR